jgi:hypothetical protein
MVDVPTIVQFNALAVRVANLETLATSLTSRVGTLESNQAHTLTSSQSLAPQGGGSGGGTGSLPRPAYQTVTPARNHDFLAIWGVDGNIAGNAQVYRDAAGVSADSAYIGARFYRESLASTQAFQIAVLQAVVTAGIRLIARPPSIVGSTTTLVIATLVTAAKSWAALGSGALALIEGPDDPFTSAISYNGITGGGSAGTWNAVSSFQSAWRTAIKADSTIGTLPVTTPTQVGQEAPNVGLQFAVIPTGAGTTVADGTAYADMLATHLYPSVNGSAAQTVDENGDHILAQLSNDFVTTVRNGYTGYTVGQAMTLPRVVTEFGISTSTGNVKVSEDIKGKNLLTGLLNLRRSAYQAVCLHELYESGDGFGLFSAKNTPNTSATYLHNAAVIFNDPGVAAATFVPTAITIGMAGLPTTAMWDLFQKADGHYQWVIWNNANNWSGSAALTIASQSVSVTWPALGTVSIYDPTIGLAAVNITSNVATATVALTDHPIIVDWIQTSV